MDAKTSILAKLGLAAGIIVFIFIAISAGKATYRKKQIKDEITRLQVQAEKVEKEKFDLEEKIEYLKSQDYKEREAKDKLGLQSPGENVVVVKPGIAKENKEDGSEGVKLAEVPAERSPNYQKWWKYFFKY